MFLPLGTDRPLRRPTLVNHALLAANIGVFLAMAALDRAQPERTEALRGLFELDPRDLAPWAFLTYAFLHADLWHLLGNMVFLWVFGPNVEDRLGRVGYVLFYLAGAAGAGALHVFGDNHAVVGASGAIAAVTGAYLVLFPHTTIKTLVIFFFIGVYAIPAWWFIGGQIAWNVWMQAANTGGNVAVLAHLGGYAFGAGGSMLLLATGLLRREPYDLFTISRQAARRRQFREIALRRDEAVRAGRHAEESFSSRARVARAQRPEAGGGALPGRSEALIAARADVAERLAAHDLAGAGAAYRRLLEAHGAKPGAALLSRRLQYDVANALFAGGDHQTAATAYDLFLQGYPTDPEVPMVRLMLGLINARYLNDPVRAKREIAEARGHLPEGEPRELAEQLLAELG